MSDQSSWVKWRWVSAHALRIRLFFSDSGGLFLERHRKYPLLVRAFLIAPSPTFKSRKFKPNSLYHLCLVSWEEQMKASYSSPCVELSFGEAPLLFLGETWPLRIVYFTCASVTPIKSTIDFRLLPASWRVIIRFFKNHLIFLILMQYL